LINMVDLACHLDQLIPVKFGDLDFLWIFGGIPEANPSVAVEWHNKIFCLVVWNIF
jgi:hypothetical protein